MTTHISIPKLDERGLSYEDLYNVILVMFKHELPLLSQYHNPTSVDDIDSYILCNTQRIFRTACTLQTIINSEKDYITASAVLRMLADSLATLYLIYQEENEDILKLRHYLYVIDGLITRLRYMSRDIQYDHKIKKEEYDAIYEQYMNSKRDYEAARTLCVNKIKSCNLYKGHAAMVDKLIECGNWKFKNLNSFKMKDNKYSWSEMYKKLTPFTKGDNFSFLSDYIHGLSTSNLIIEEDEIVFEPIYSMALSLLGLLSKLIHTRFESELNMIKPYMINALLDEQMPKQYFDYLIQQYNNTH